MDYNPGRDLMDRGGRMVTVEEMREVIDSLGRCLVLYQTCPCCLREINGLDVGGIGVMGLPADKFPKAYFLCWHCSAMRHDPSYRDTYHRSIKQNLRKNLHLFKIFRKTKRT